jgi:hypothetical protein
MIPMPPSPAKVRTLAYMLARSSTHVIPEESSANDNAELDHRNLLAYTVSYTLRERVEGPSQVVHFLLRVKRIRIVRHNPSFRPEDVDVLEEMLVAAKRPRWDACD